MSINIKALLIIVASLAVNFFYAQCSITYTVIPPSCSPGGDGKIIITLPPFSCYSSPTPTAYNILVSGSSCATISPLNNVGPGTHTISNVSSCGFANGLLLFDDSYSNFLGSVNVYVVTPNISSFVTGPVSPKCYGACDGSVQVTFIGGYGFYNYTLTPQSGSALTGISSNGTILGSSLCAGTYTLNVNDQVLCSASRTLNFVQPSALATSTIGTSVFCSGNCAAGFSVSPSGGTPGYTVSFNPGSTYTVGPGNTAALTSLCASTVPIIATLTDAKGCTLTAVHTVTATSSMSISPASTAVSCYGGVNGCLTSSVNGGTGPFTYTWLPTNVSGNSLCGLSAGTYSVLVKDANNCSLSQTIVLAQPAQITTSVSITGAACFGYTNGCISSFVSGGTGPFTYTWLPSGVSNSSLCGLSSGTYSLFVKDANNCSLSQSVTLSQPSQISTNLTTTNISCYGGATGCISIYPGGGTAPYTNTWLPSNSSGTNICGLSSGTYSLLVNDANNCSLSQTINLNQAQQISSSITSTALSCFGSANGCLSSSVSGGTGPFTYSWLPSNSGSANVCSLSSGAYTLLVKDANNCNFSQTVTLTQPPPIVSNITNTAVSCFGLTNGCLSSSVTGGTAPFTYTWLPSNVGGVSLCNLAAGVYTLLVKDINNCDVSQTITMTQPQQLISVVASTAISCFGSANGCISTSVSGGTPPFTYTWLPANTNSPGVCGLPSGNYSLTIKDGNNCTMSQTVMMTQPVAISTTLSAVNPSCTTCCDGQIQANVSGGTSPFTYTIVPGNLAAVNGAFTGLCTGTYTIDITDANSCSHGVVTTLTSNVATGLEDNLNTGAVMVYPNPASGRITITTQGIGLENSIITVLDQYGKIVAQKKEIINNCEIGLTDIAKGIYILQVKTPSGQNISRKLIVE